MPRCGNGRLSEQTREAADSWRNAGRLGAAQVRPRRGVSECIARCSKGISRSGKGSSTTREVELSPPAQDHVQGSDLMDQIIEQSLAGKRFGLMGFEPAEADSIIAVLKTVRGIGSVVGWAPNVLGLNSLSRFDACIINTSAIGSREQP